MQDYFISDKEVLSFLETSGTIDLALVLENIEMNKRKELLTEHPYAIWQGKDGKWRTYIPDKEKGRVLKKRNTRKSIEDAVIDYLQEEVYNPTIKDIFNEWNNERLAFEEISISTHNRYINDFDRFFGSFGERKIKAVTAEDVEKFIRRTIADFDLTQKAFSNFRIIVYGIFKRAKKKKYISFSITEELNDMEFSKRSFKKVLKEDKEEVFTEEEYPVIMEYLDENPDLMNLGIKLIFGTGLRVGELAALRFSDIEENVIHVHATEVNYQDKENKRWVCTVRETPKTEAGIRDVVVPLEYVSVIKRLRQMNPDSEFIFEVKGRRLRGSSFRSRLYKLCDKLGIVRKSPHKIRKTYGTILLDNNIDKVLITQQMGHTDILCTEKHYHRNRKSIDRKAEILNSIPELMAR